MPRIAYLVGVLFVTQAVSAQARDDYRCTIGRVASAEGNESASARINRELVGKEFTVDRRSGFMAGALKNSYITTPQIIDIGSSGNSFKAVTILRKEQGIGEGSNVHVLVVNEFEKSAAKSFVFLDNSDVYFGNCIHF